MTEGSDPACAAPDYIRPERLSILLKIGLRLTAERDLDRLLRMIIEETTSVMDADRSSLFLIDRERDEMWAKIAEGAGTTEIRFPVGTGIAGTVGRTGEIINIPDAYQDSRFNPEFDKRTGFRTASILCAPLRNMQGAIIGAVQVLNKREGTFTADDEALLAALASQAAIALENADLYTKLRDLNQRLEEKVEERTADLVAANERLSVLNQELEQISITDSLTHAFNRRFFMERIRQEVKRANRYGNAVSLLMIDIDHFKQVNDTHGHQIGDRVLAGVAGLIASHLRDTDVLARYGGEEFALIATPMDLEGARTLAERIRKLVESNTFAGEVPIRVTVSIGVSAWKSFLQENFEVLIREADKALYRAKDAGRNRVQTA
ncbi:MAG: diguanylate cyclase [Nitrospirota bacterium]|nr:diguanylate cyclase [Nitrospirota bacterium]